MNVLIPALLGMCFAAPLSHGSLNAPVLQEQAIAATPQQASAPHEESPGPASYAARETAAGDLEQFRGGSLGLVIVVVVVVVAVVLLVAIIIPW